MNQESDNPNRRRTPWVQMLVALVIVAAAMSATIIYVLDLESEFAKLIVLDEADRYTTALEEFRTLYTSEVIERVRVQGVDVTHDYEKSPGAIPLPATLSMLLGARLGNQRGGGARLYSNHPFPWRARTGLGGPQDPFEAQALNALQANPDAPYYTFEPDIESPRLRYAVADRMRESCVNCHNSHPDSPKRDWRTGQVRGVLAVTIPLGDASAKARSSLRGVFALALGGSAWGIIALVLLVIRLRATTREAEAFAANTRVMNVTLGDEIARREQAEAEQQALQAQMLHTQKLESLGLLAGGIGHDFNNFLQGILGHAQLAEMKLESESDPKPNLEQVQELVGQAAGLTEQLLAYAGKTLVSRDLLNLSELVSEMKPLTSTMADGTLDIQYSLAENLPAVEGTAAQLRQVVLNLLTNAADAVRENEGAINVRTGILEQAQSEDQQGDELINSEIKRVYVEVEDAGVGMSDDTLSKAFDPFFTTKSQGRGLGLAALHGIVRGHGGRLEVDSERGRGTRFRVVLPGVRGTPNPHSASPKTMETYEGRTALVVDDYEYVRQATCDTLKGLGCSAFQAKSGPEAIEIFEKHQKEISVVILDLLMPEMNGFEVLKSLRLTDPEIPILLVSAHADPKEVDEMLLKKNVLFLRKPYSNAQLLDSLQELTSPTEE